MNDLYKGPEIPTLMYYFGLLDTPKYSSLVDDPLTVNSGPE